MEHDDALRRHLKSLGTDELEETTADIIRRARQSQLFVQSALFREQVVTAEKSLDKFSDAVAHETAMNLLHEIEMDEKIDKLRAAYEQMRAAAIEAILTNDPNREGFIQMAREFIANEKAHGLHNAEDWQDLEGLL